MVEFVGMHKPFLLLLFLLVPAFLFGDTCSDLAAAKTATYGFRPSQLDKQQREAKDKAVDAFWTTVKTAGPSGLECVRKMVAQEKSDVFFLYNAAALLALLDPSGSSDAAIEDGMSRTDLTEANMLVYLAAALDLSRRGRDIGKVAGRYLHHPQVDTYLPKTLDKLDRTNGALLLYGSMSPDLVDDYLSKEVASPELSVRDAVASVWSLNMTERSFAGLARLGQMQEFSEPTRRYVQGILTSRQVTVTPPKYTREQMLARFKRFPVVDTNIDEAEGKALDNSTYATLTPADLPVVREARRRMVRTVSKESIGSYVQMSRVLLTLVNKLDMYRTYRKH